MRRRQRIVLAVPGWASERRRDARAQPPPGRVSSMHAGIFRLATHATTVGGLGAEESPGGSRSEIARGGVATGGTDSAATFSGIAGEGRERAQRLHSSRHGGAGQCGARLRLAARLLCLARTTAGFERGGSVDA